MEQNMLYYGVLVYLPTLLTCHKTNISFHLSSNLLHGSENKTLMVLNNETAAELCRFCWFTVKTKL